MIARFFHFYWSVYVPDHSAPLNRWVHFSSNLAALFFCGLGLATQTAWVFALGVWFQLGPPYLGHILFEKTHRSIDQSPIWAAVGSWYTTSQILLGRQSVTYGPSTPGVEIDRSRLVELVQRHGRNLHSFMALEPGLRVWATPDQDAAVAYASHGRVWAAVGGPLCEPGRTVEVARAFADAARRAGAQAAFFGMSDAESTALSLASGFDVLPVGQAPTWDPGQWSTCVATSRKLRNRLRRGNREGLRPRVLAADDVAPGQPLRQALEDLAENWLAARSMPPLGFMVRVELFAHAEARRFVVVERDGRIEGAAVCVPVYGRGGWLLEDLLLAPTAPAGTSELLVDAVMRRLADEKAQVVSLGLVALAGLDDIGTGRPHPFWDVVLRACARGLRPLYDFEGLYRFRRKLRPTAWEPIYVVAAGTLSVLTMRGVLMAFADGWLPAYGARLAARWAARALGGVA